MHNNMRPGSLVYWQGKPAIIQEFRGLSEAIIRMVEDFRTEIAPASGLSSYLQSPGRSPAHHLTAAETSWNKGVTRLELIRPLLENPGRTMNDVELVARSAGKSSATIYRWLSRFEKSGLVTSLIRTPRSDRGGSRLEKEVEDVVQRVIQEEFLTDQRKSVLKVYEAIKLACHEDDLTPPNRNTIYERIRAIDDRIKMSERVGPKAAKEKYEPLRGKFPGADFPLAVVQIDHTPMDIIVVDEEDRIPISRPFLTISLDVYSKMIHGFCMSLEHPSTLTAGLALGHGVARKDEWLAKRNITESWPIYGKPRKIHTDNGSEFVGKTFGRACDEHNIKQEWRPKGQPNYGPHIERAFRTFMGEVHNLPGTTFSNVAQRLDYDSAGHACMTLKELELWFTYFVIYVYHQRPHAGITDVAPINLYNQAVHGTDKSPGIGLPAPIQDEHKFRLDFTPFVTRTVQVGGVTIDYIQYQAPILRKWVARTDPTTGKSMSFHFARDPRDISIIYFLDPDTNQYEPIPYADRTRPPISIWELDAIVAKLGESPLKIINEALIFEGLKKMHRVEKEALEKTRLAKQARSTEKRKRTMRARRKGWEDVHTPKNAAPTFTPTEEDDDDDIQPFSAEVR
jgi:putative transposase